LTAQTFVSEQRFFQGDRGIKPLIHSFVHGTHSTLSELTNYPITTLKYCVWRQHLNSLCNPHISACFDENQADQADKNWKDESKPWKSARHYTHLKHL
jgi:hypothetical protein